MYMLKVVCFAVIMLASNLTLANERDTVRIAVGEWPPYLSEQSPHFGVAAHIVREAFQAIGLDVEYQFFPWARVLVYVENGVFDASILWVETEERRASLHFSEVALVGEAVFFYNRDNPLVWREISDLSGTLFGGLLSASYPWYEAAREAGIPLEMVLVPTEIQNVAKLLEQRIDAYAMDKLVGLHLLQQNFPDLQEQIAFDARPVEAWPYRLIFTKNDRGALLADAFNQGLDSIRQQGFIEAALNNVAKGAYLPSESASSSSAD